MSDRPVFDSRTDEELLAWMQEVAPYYVDRWDPERPDAGTALFRIFSHLTEDVIEQLNRIPEKQRAVFLDALGFDPLPPQASKLPVTFVVDDDTSENVPIPTRTTVTAPATDDRDEQPFETVGDRKFEATPATLQELYAVDPGIDRIVDHGNALADEESVELFTGKNRQTHSYYLGHPELLTLNPGATIDIELKTNATEPALEEALVWEYYGENEDGEEGWHEIEFPDQARSARSLSAVQQIESFIERIGPTLNGRGYETVEDEPTYNFLRKTLVDNVLNGRFTPYRAVESAEDAEFPPNLVETTDLESPVVRRISQRLTSLRRNLESLRSGDQFGSTLAETTVSLTIPGEVTEHEIEGTESRWLRCRIPDAEFAPPLFEMFSEPARGSVGSDTETGSAGLPLDEAVREDVSLDVSGPGPFYPLGDYPTETTEFMFACEEAFTKPGASVDLVFETDADIEYDTPGLDPQLVWEYWNGDGWRRLDVEDGTDSLRSSGVVSFEVPLDIEESIEMGANRHWLRTRLVEGNYGEFSVQNPQEEGWERSREQISPPRYSGITVEYSRSSVPFRTQLTHNNLSFRDVSNDLSGFRLFDPPVADSQTLYLGFDRQLRGGPLHLYLPIERATYPTGFAPRIDVEYCPDPSLDQWSRLDLRDGTEDLTGKGIVAFSLPAPTTSFELFGRERHWIRVRVTGDEFRRSAEDLFDRPERGVVSQASMGELSSESIATRERRSLTRMPPTVDGFQLNTEWARNAETIDDETLGSSSGVADQTFSFDNRPVLEAVVWVDELPTLSGRERQALEQDDTTSVAPETDEDGTLRSFWVRWSGEPDLLTAGPTERAYVLDRIDGTVRFGDGQNGRIPADGDKNIKADYRTGGGDDGDVAVGAVASLEDNLPLIDEVYNPGPGETGEPEETTEEYLSRAPKRLRDRDRPVTRDGFERIALSAAREIEKVRCCAGKQETGEIGTVTILIVPDVGSSKPIPSEELIEQVEAEMYRKAPEAVVSDEAKLRVHGPNYVEVSVAATIETSANQSVTEVQEAVEEALTGFLHPLTGGVQGNGWPIGSAPAPGAITAYLEERTVIDRVVSTTVTYTEGQNETTLMGEESTPSVPLDALVCSGRHSVTVTVDRTGDEV